jgi:phage shock protein C
MLDRTWKIVLGIGIAAGVCAIVLSLIGGTHLHWQTQESGGVNIDLRIGAGGGFPSQLLGTVSVLCLLLGSAFFAATKQATLPAPVSSTVEKTGTTTPGSFLDFLKVLRRSSSDFWLGGVCGGLGQYSPVPTWVWRVVFLVLIFCFGTGLIAYLILWACMPKEEFPPLPPRKSAPPPTGSASESGIAP